MNIDKIRKDFTTARIERLFKHLKERNITSYFTENKKDAVKYILDKIPENSSIGFGGSETVREIGLRDALNEINCQIFDQYEKGITKEESAKRRKEGVTADFFITGTNAITEDGILINIDGVGNRLAGLAYGGDRVFIVIGTNKIVSDIEAGIWRIMNITAPMNVRRLNITDPPCYEDGFCTDCDSPNRICNQIHIIERSALEGRITVVMVNELLGL